MTQRMEGGWYSIFVARDVKRYEERRSNMVYQKCQGWSPTIKNYDKSSHFPPTTPLKAHREWGQKAGMTVQYHVREPFVALSSSPFSVRGGGGIMVKEGGARTQKTVVSVFDDVKQTRVSRAILTVDDECN